MNINEVYSGFRVEEISYVKEINGTAHLMKHEKSGARLLYIESTDTNKVFHIAFRTPPSDSTGVAHILEHSVLCGSRKFPLREPFVELVKGSLNTFLNAMTYSDKTVYPVASKNDKDFKNLMDVYLDAVFYPRAAKDPMIMMQEGWHYDLESPEDDLTYKGVVYNEMKGVFSSADSILDHYKLQNLYPHTTYGNDSGGYPENITDLTHDKFQSFYESFYHPSNSYIYLYGDMNIEETLSFIDGEYLSNFDAIHVDSHIDLEPPFKEGVVAQYPYGIGNDEKEEGKAIHSLTYVFQEMDLTKSLAFEVLTHALFTSAAAPIKEALIKGGVGNDVTGYYLDGIRQPLLEINVTGSDIDKQSLLQNIVESTIRQLVENGLDKELLEASLNRIEFALREADFGGRPIGLAYGLRVMDNWLYDKNPIDILRYESSLQALRKGIENNFFEELLETYILGNNHKGLISVYPQKGLLEEKEAEEKEKLRALKATMTAEEIDHIVRQTAELKRMQTTPDTQEALETIPLLEIADLDATVEPIERIEETIDGVKVHFIPTSAHGINYVSFFFNLDCLTEDELFYAQLLSDVVGRLDTTTSTYNELAKAINLNLGGFTMDVMPIAVHRSRSAYVPLMVVRGKSLAIKIEKLTSIIGEILGSTVFTNVNRLQELVKEAKAIWDTDAFRRGNTLVTNLIAAQVSDIGKFRDADGLGYFKGLAELVKDEKALEALPERLLEVGRKIFRLQNVEASFIGEAHEFDAFKEHIHDVLDVLGTEQLEIQKLVFNKDYKNQGITTSGKVQYVGKGGNFRDHGADHTGAMSVLETILRYDYLWNRIRVQGGAYGAFVHFQSNGNMVLCSYRDPNLKNTLDVYDNLPNFLRELTISDREMRKYIIGTMSGLDLPNTPFLRGARAMNMYFGQTNEAAMQEFRQQVIDTKLEDIKALADVIENVLKDNHVVVMGNEQKIKDEEFLFDEVVSLPQ